VRAGARRSERPPAGGAADATHEAALLKSLPVEKEATLLKSLLVGKEATLLKSLLVGKEATLLKSLLVEKEATLLKSLLVGKEAARLTTPVRRWQLARGGAPLSDSLPPAFLSDFADAVFRYRL
jgi:hypothetical protein